MATIKNAEIIIGEGITEEYYFKSLRDILVTKPTPIHIKPYNMEELDKKIRECATMGYTRIYCLIDMDNKVDTPAKMEKYQRLKHRYHNKRVGKTDCEVCFYESHPSIELFFYYYFEMSTAEKSNNGLKSWLKGKCEYNTSEKYLTSHSLHNTFLSKGGCIQNAIRNAETSTQLRTADNYNCSYTEIGALIETLGIK